MSQEKIAKGDVVCLKSGGHDMTAARDPDEDGDVLCKWFVAVPGAGWDQLEEGWFPVATLEFKR
jgi:uncharacterized protein YodC (DUF2158 family)